MIEETEASIQKLVLETGEALSFDTFSINAIFGFTNNQDFADGSVYGIDRQIVTFNCSTADCIANNLADKNTFTTTDGRYEYSFEVNGYPITQFDGWSRFYAFLVNKEEIL